MRGLNHDEPLLLDVVRPGSLLVQEVCGSGGRTCSVCVMDTTDPQIRFYDEGGCSHCVPARIRAEGFVADRQEPLKRMIETLGARD